MIYWEPKCIRFFLWIPNFFGWHGWRTTLQGVCKPPLCKNNTSFVKPILNHVLYTHTWSWNYNRMHWDFTTDKVKWLGHCFGWWDALCHYIPHMKVVSIFWIENWALIGFLHPFSYDPSKAEANFPFPFCWVVMVFVFFLWQNITFPFPFCWVVMAFVFPLAKHHISPSLLLGYLFAMLGTENWTEAFCFQIEEVFWPSLSLPPFLPPQKNMKTKNVSKLLVHFIHITYSPYLSKYITSSPPPDISTTFLSRIKVVCTMHMWVPKMNKANLT